MIQERVIAGLDIGSAKTTVVIAEAVGDIHRQPSIKILGVGQARTTGLRKGIVSDIEETTRSIKKAVEDAERMAGTNIDSIYAGIAGEHVRAIVGEIVVLEVDHRKPAPEAEERARGDGVVDLGSRQGFVIPKTVRHRTRAPTRTVILMIERADIVPTGD